MFLFSSPPRCSDIDSIEDYFRTLLQFYREPFENIDLSKVTISTTEFNFSSFSTVCSNLSDTVDIKLHIDENLFDEGNEMAFGLPLVFRHNYDEKSQLLYLQFSNWGYNYFEIAFVELILLLADIKLKRSKAFNFEFEEESGYRRILTAAAIFFGFGFFLLQRWNISSNKLLVDSLGNEWSSKLKYFVPLNLDAMIYSSVLISLMNKDDSLFVKTALLNQDIHKEIKVCQRYIYKKSNLYFQYKNGDFGKNTFSVLRRSIKKYQ